MTRTGTGTTGMGWHLAYQSRSRCICHTQFNSRTALQENDEYCKMKEEREQNKKYFLLFRKNEKGQFLQPWKSKTVTVTEGKSVGLL